MIELDFREPESFKTPDGQEWIVKPLPTVDMKMVVEFAVMEDKQKELQKQGKTKEMLKVIYDDMLGLANKLVDKSIVNKETGDKLSQEWRTPYLKLVQIARIVISESVGNPDQSGDGIPLELPANSSKSSGATSTPSKKKAGRKKNS